MSDEEDKYNLLITRKELKACITPSESLGLTGSRLKNSEDRLYSLLRHKVSGKKPMKLRAALRQREAKAQEAKRREEERKLVAEEARRAEEDRAKNIALPPAEDRERRDLAKSEDDSLDGFEVFEEEDIRMQMDYDNLSGEDESLFGSVEKADSDIITATSQSREPKVPVCFRPQTSHDRRKMQPPRSKAEHIAQLQDQLKDSKKLYEKQVARAEAHKRARATALIAKQEAEKREARIQEEVASERLELNKQRLSLQRERAALKHDQRNQNTLNSKINKDFW
ncbi:hypothetical protein CC79DRAFT_196413 [Sarocladium strictum]